jgi:hypothetical protein
MKTHSCTPHNLASLIKIVKALLLLFPLMLATPGKMSAYADPGTGAFLYQAAYAACLGGSFYLRKLLDRIAKRPPQIVIPAVTPERYESAKNCAGAHTGGSGLERT